MPATLTRYLHAFRSLNVNRTGGRASPHKPCMLLAVLGLAEAGDLQRNEIRFDPALLERYAKFFAAVQGDTDHPNPYFPFFHLKSEGFWHLQPLPGREAVAGAMSSARSAAAITANIAWATLDADLHALAQDEPSRTALRETLLVAWFADRRSRLLPVLADERGSDRYQWQLRDSAAGNTSCLPTHRPSPRAAPPSAASSARTTTTAAPPQAGESSCRRDAYCI